MKGVGNISNNSKQMKIVITIFLSAFSVFAYCQDKKTAQEDDIYFKAPKDTISNKGWQKGYIVMREKGDTVYGLVRRRAFMGNPFEWLDFKLNETANKKPYRGDSINAFKYGDEIWKCFTYCGWAKKILTGAIDVYKGQIIRPGYKTNSVYDCLVFKKGTQPAKFIGADETKILSGQILKEKPKAYFKEYIEDEKEILNEFENENFSFKELTGLITKYNKSKVDSKKQ